MWIAVIMSFITGIAIVVSRISNAHLADNTSALTSTFYNYLVGLSVSVVVMLLLGGAEGSFFAAASWPAMPQMWWWYTGGLLGVGLVTISNVVVTKLSSFYVTLLMFVGQIFTGILLDAILSGTLSVGNLVGGVLVAVGLIYNLMVDRKEAVAA